MAIQSSSIEVPSKWGRPARYPFLKHSGASTKLAVLFPGKAYPLDAPVLWYAAQAARQAGYDVIGVEYGFQSNRCDMTNDDMDDIVQEAAGALQSIVSSGYSRTVFIGKSIGTAVACEVSRRLGQPVSNQVFLTPVRRTIPSIIRTDRALVVVGDNDDMFEQADVAQVTGRQNVQVHVIPNANHGLEIADDSIASIGALQEVTRLCSAFLKSVQ